MVQVYILLILLGILFLVKVLLKEINLLLFILIDFLIMRQRVIRLREREIWSNFRIMTLFVNLNIDCKVMY